jgi:hypothetical protein
VRAVEQTTAGQPSGTTVEPAFGIIKSVLGFRRFLLRGLEKVELEWALVCTAYNLKRLHRLAGLLKDLSCINPSIH